LVRSPELLLLDEPTVGVDPLSRRELWEIIQQLVNEQGLTVLLSTAYLDEAERCSQVVVLHEGKVLAQGPPNNISELAQNRTFMIEPGAGQKAGTVQARLLDHPAILDALPEGGHVRFVTKAKAGLDDALFREPVFTSATAFAVPPRFEDGFMVLLQGSTDKEKERREDKQTDSSAGETRRQGRGKTPSVLSPGLRVSLSPSPPEAAVQVSDLVRRFGKFTAVDHVSFEVRRGEIFGLLGPNGAGKTTTFRMLCGLLAASGGIPRVAGMDLRRARASARQRIGYVAQKFSLYGQLSVGENLEFFASAYNLRGERKERRIRWALDEFGLEPFAGLPSGQLPDGYKQRLAMATALVHEPEILFLDEPTSGADPLARREFWRRIVALAQQGVTIIVTTHFMEEAEYCDRVAIMDAGRVLAQGTPAEIRQRPRIEGREPTMEDAFIAIVEDARESAQGQRSGAAA
jgi:ABC-2 type transport system ATP-binding protein